MVETSYAANVATFRSIGMPGGRCFGNFACAFLQKPIGFANRLRKEQLAHTAFKQHQVEYGQG